MKRNSRQTKMVIDIDAVLEFIFAPDERHKSNISLQERYAKLEDVDELMLIEKLKQEEKGGEDSSHEAIRMNLFNMLAENISNLGADYTAPDEDTGMMEALSFNTLVQYGFIKEIEV